MGGYKKDDRPRGARADVVYVTFADEDGEWTYGDRGTVVGPGSTTHPIQVRPGRARRADRDRGRALPLDAGTTRPFKPEWLSRTEPAKLVCPR